MRHDEISRDSWLTQVTNKVHTSSRLPFRVKDATISSLFLKPINSKDSFDSFYPVKRTVHFQKEKKEYPINPSVSKVCFKLNIW